MKRTETAQEERRNSEQNKRGEGEAYDGEEQNNREPAGARFGIAPTTCPGFDGEATKGFHDGKPKSVGCQEHVGHSPQLRRINEQSVHHFAERRTLAEIVCRVLQSRLQRRRSHIGNPENGKGRTRPAFQGEAKKFDRLTNRTETFPVRPLAPEATVQCRADCERDHPKGAEHRPQNQQRWKDDHRQAGSSSAFRRPRCRPGR